MVQGHPDHDPDLEAARDAVLADHRETVTATLAAADAVDGRFDGPITDGPALATALERTLRDHDLLAALLSLLGTAVEATGRSFAATPVPAPPYLAVTSRGPVLRATDDGGRVVVAVTAFAVERAPTRYVRTGTDPATALTVEFRPDPGTRA